eukprot:TRINITY_DN47786_c0_g1_i1.p1 TRINITY_DN47786_c0_g1~~TRINITY_DN47786_c0_g1_i1.p1  ORF type:complete len:135 (-),score=18.07 TRINITY_DN47786_c0_g1_i1:528-932(-)
MVVTRRIGCNEPSMVRPIRRTAATWVALETILNTMAKVRMAMTSKNNSTCNLCTTRRSVNVPMTTIPSGREVMFCHETSIQSDIVELDALIKIRMPLLKTIDRNAIVIPKTSLPLSPAPFQADCPMVARTVPTL